MQLRSLSLSRYGSFRERQTLAFPSEPGLHFMQGRNLVDPRLGGNGAGKSTIWNALYWLIYGRTPDGRKASEIANWEAGKGTSVMLEYEYPGGDQVFVERTWGPIKWELTLLEDGYATSTEDLAKAETNQFLADVGASAAVFQQCVMMAQGEPMFLDLKREPQTELFGAVLGLDRWLDYSNKASVMARRADDECRRLEAEIARLEGQASAIKDYRAEAMEFDRKRRERIDALLTDFDFCNSGVVADKAKLDKVRASIKDWEDRLECVIEKRRVLRERVEAGEFLIKDHSEQLASTRRDAEAIEARIKIHESGQCPTCGVDLTSGPHHDKVVERDLAWLEKKTPQVKELMTLVQSFEQGQKKLRGELEDAEEAVEACRAELDKLDRQARNLRAEIDRANRQLDDIEDQVKRLEDEPNPFAALQQQAQDRTRTTQDALKAARQGLEYHQQRQSLYGFWIRGFKELRLQQIADALDELEVEVNSSLAELGLDGWELRFDVDRETKAGNVQRGFSVTVLSPANAKPVPWESWSGGEQQRLRLAGNMGLANLIRTRMGVTFPLEVWDEPTKGLSPEGVRDLLACLERRARVEGRQIWIIDHTAHNFGGFASTATIIKDRNGSRIEQN